MEIHSPALEGAAGLESNASMLNVLKNRSFLLLWIAQILSQTAQQIVNIALVLQISEITKSSTATSGIIICFTIPAIILSAIAGVFVERYPKKTILTLTNVARGVIVLGYLLVETPWGAGAVVPIFYINTLLFSGVSQFFNPAEASMIPLIVKPRELVAANSLFNLTLPATQLGGFVLLGPLLLATVFHHNFAGLYIVIFILCIAAAACTHFLPRDRRGSLKVEVDEVEATASAAHKHSTLNVPVPAFEPVVLAPAGVSSRKTVQEPVIAPGQNLTTPTKDRSGARVAFDELVEGVRFIRRDAVIVSAIIYWSIAIAVFMMLGTIGPLFLDRVLHIDQSQLFYILIPGGLGLVIGVIVVGKISKAENRELMINLGLLAAGAILCVFAVAGPVISLAYGASAPPELLIMAIMGIITLVLGVSNSFISVPAQTALQERAPEAIRARVFSAFYTVQNMIILVPVLLAGLLADSFGYVQTVVGIGICVILIAAFGLWQMRQRRDKAVVGAI